ncbi:hypothetical protein B484DRAFT_472042, partial [Ochromonadaceae sp. CCMP2298]
RRIGGGKGGKTNEKASVGADTDSEVNAAALSDAEALVKKTVLCFTCGLRGHIAANCEWSKDFAALRSKCKAKQEKASPASEASNCFTDGTGTADEDGQGGNEPSEPNDDGGSAAEASSALVVYDPTSAEPTSADVSFEDWLCDRDEDESTCLAAEANESSCMVMETVSIDGEAGRLDSGVTGVARGDSIFDDGYSGGFGSGFSDSFGNGLGGGFGGFSDSNASSDSDATELCTDFSASDCSNDRDNDQRSELSSIASVAANRRDGEEDEAAHIARAPFPLTDRAHVPDDRAHPVCQPCSAPSHTPSHGLNPSPQLVIDAVGPVAAQTGGCSDDCDCDYCVNRRRRIDDEEPMPGLIDGDSEDDDDDDDGGQSGPRQTSLVLRYVDDVVVFSPAAEEEETGSAAGGHDRDCDTCCPVVEFCVSAKLTKKPKKILDSGCTSHCSGDEVNPLENFRECTEFISLGNSKFRVKSEGRGDLGLLRDVMWTPDMSYSMISVSALDMDDMISVFGGGRCLVLDAAVRDKVLALIAEQPQSATVLTATLRDRLYQVDDDTAAAGISQPLREGGVEPYVYGRDREKIKGSQGTLRNGSTAGLNPLELLHLRSGHASKKTILAGLRVNAFLGAQTTYEACRKLEIRPCDPCLRGGERQGHLTASSTDYSQLLPMQDVGLDPVKLSTTALGGENYVNFGHCYGTRLAASVATKAEGNQVAVIKELQRKWCDPYGHVIKTLHTDFASIFLSTAVQEYLLDKGIKHDCSTPHQHSHNL